MIKIEIYGDFNEDISKQKSLSGLMYFIFCNSKQIKKVKKNNKIIFEVEEENVKQN